MTVETKHFGKVDIDDNKKLHFENGIYGFEYLKDFVILYSEEDGIFCWLQSLEESSIALPMIDPILFFPNYKPEVPKEIILKLGEAEEEDFKLYTIVVVPEDITKMTTNLMAPVLINTKTKRGIQVIIDDNKYKIKENLYERFRKLEQVGD